jgi:hypothetical protein
VRCPNPSVIPHWRCSVWTYLALIHWGLLSKPRSPVPSADLSRRAHAAFRQHLIPAGTARGGRRRLFHDGQSAFLREAEGRLDDLKPFGIDDVYAGVAPTGRQRRVVEAGYRLAAMPCFRKGVASGWGAILGVQSIPTNVTESHPNGRFFVRPIASLYRLPSAVYKLSRKDWAPSRNFPVIELTRWVMAERAQATRCEKKRAG